MSSALREYPPLIIKRNARTRFRHLWKYRYLYLLMLPGLISLIIFHYIPLYGIIIAFQDYKLGRGFWGSDWVGLKHFIDVFRAFGIIGAESLRAVKNTVILSLYTFAVGFPVTILFAIFLNEVNNSSLKKTVQTISYFPYFLSWVAVSGLIIDILSPTHGLVNKLLVLLGGQPVYFLVYPSYFKTILVFSGLWKGIGWGSIIYIAMIAGANPELYEAARVDGAGRIRQTLHVTIPAMYPMISIGLIFALSGIMNAGDFDQIYNLVNSQNLSSAEVISVWVYRVGIGQYNFSEAAALGLMNNLIAIMLLFVANKIASRVSEYALW